MKNGLKKLIEKWKKEKGSYTPNAPIYQVFIDEAKDVLEKEEKSFSNPPSQTGTGKKDNIVNYREVKNYLHNDLGLDQDKVMELAEKYIEKKLDKMIGDKLDSMDFSRYVFNEVSKVINNKNDKRYMGMFRKEESTKYIESVVEETVKREIIKKINFNIDIKLNDDEKNKK
jgi:hypothetical protein